MRRVLLGIMCGVFCFVQTAHAQDFFCPPGAKLVTSSELAQLQACGATNITVGMCLDTATQSILSLPQCAEAKTFLKSLPKETPSQCGTESNVSIDGLNAQFSICAANFIKAFSAINGPVRINSAYRSQSQQQCVCSVAAGMCGGQGTYNAATGQVEGGSNHLRGVALDITPLNGDFVKLHAFAAANPGFGVSFPLGMADKQHMEPTVPDGPCAKPGAANLTAIPPSSTVAAPPTPNLARPVTFAPSPSFVGSVAGTYLLQLLNTPSYVSPYTPGSGNSVVSPYNYYVPSGQFVGTANTGGIPGSSPIVVPEQPATTSVGSLPAPTVEDLLGTRVMPTAVTLVQPVLALVQAVSALPNTTTESIIIGLYTQIVALLTQVVAVLTTGR